MKKIEELDWDKSLLTCKELAHYLGKEVKYVYAMRNYKGENGPFVMPANQATLNEARQWLRENPEFRQNNVWENIKKLVDVHKQD